MFFQHETARNTAHRPLNDAEKIFAGKLQGKSDAVYLDSSRERVFAVSGLPFSAPAAEYLAGLSGLQELFAGNGSLLLKKDGEQLRLYKEENETALTPAQQEELRKALGRVLNAPGELNEKGEWTVDLQTVPVGTHYPVNLLLGDRENYEDPLQTTPKSVVDALGHGSFRSAQEKQVLATRYVLSPEENGEPFNRQFYLTEKGKQIFYSGDPVTNVAEAKATHGNNYTKIVYRTECGLKIERTIFLLPQQEGMPSAVEAQRIVIANESGMPRELRIVATGMFGISDPSTISGDIVYANVVVESELCSFEGKPVALSAHHKPKDCQVEKRFAMLLCDGEGMDEYTSSLSAFLGKGTVEQPENLARLNNAPLRRGAAFFAMARTLKLEAGEAKTVDTFAGMTLKDHDANTEFDLELWTLYRYYRDPQNLEKTFRKICADAEAYRSYLQLRTGDRDLDAYVSYNLPFQVLYQTYVSRSFAWTQKSYRETGFREIQDLYASVYYLHAQGKDALIKRLLRSWIENVFGMGYAYHNFTTRGKEPGMCSDDALWLVQAVHRYVYLSGDHDFLKQRFAIAGSQQDRPLIETLKAIITYSGKISVGKHGLPLLDRADWNDTLRLDKGVLEGPEKEELYLHQLQKNGHGFGTAFENEQSESVMNAFLLVIAAEELKDLAKLCDEPEICAFAAATAEEMRENTRRYAWKQDYYARCLLNDSREYKYLGSTGDRLSADPAIDGSYFLNSFSWSLLSDTATPEQIRSMLDIVDRYLKTDAGLKLCTLVEYDRLGITTGTSFYFPGDRENGGVFKHAAMMATVASLQKARTLKDKELAGRLKDLAFFMIRRTLPYTAMEDPFRLKGNPRFCTQYNNSETGENIGPILSGTASWLTLALYEVCGIRYEDGAVCFEPVCDRPYFAYVLKPGETEIRVEIDASKDYRLNENSHILLDGEPQETARVVLDGQKHELKITL